MNSTTTPKVFISYSWSPRLLQEKVIDLASRLQSDGVHVVIDIWDLAEGQDKNKFMEQMVCNPEIKKVLIFCTKSYMEKANSRNGGVGTESMIISEEVYSNAEQEKFIPIVFEKDTANNPYKPAFIRSRIHIDLTEGDEYENNYERLIRNIFGRPEHKRPPIGMAPSHLWAEDSTFIRTTNKVEQLKNSIIHEKKNVKYLIEDFMDTYLTALQDDFNVDLSSDPSLYDEPVVQGINNTILLRNDFVIFLQVLIKSDHFNAEIFCKFFEKLVQRFVVEKQGYSVDNFVNEHKRFLVYEMFLYTGALLLENENFDNCASILTNLFFIYNERREKNETYSYAVFCFYSKLLNDFRNNRLKLNRVSIVADMIKTRSNIRNISFDRLKEVDLLLYYIYQVRSTNEVLLKEGGFRWFPFLSCYYFRSISFFERAASKKYLDRLIPIFGLNNITELKECIRRGNLDSSNYNLNYDIPPISRGLNIEKLGVYP